MARFITRIADLCRQRAAEEQFLRRFRMMRIGEDDDDSAGPGWYESSRELEDGLQVHEGPPGDALLLAEWMEAWRRPLALPHAAPAR